MLRTESSEPPWTSAAVNAVVTEPLSQEDVESDALRHRADLVEIRADLVGDVATARLRDRTGGRLVYCLRSRDHGGEFDGSTEERHARLLAAAEYYDVVDLEAEHDLAPDILNRIPGPQRRISWHGTTAEHSVLHERFDRMATVGACLYLLTTDVSRAEQALAPLRFLHDIGRSDVTAFATGSAGVWSRLLAPRLGAPVAFGNLSDSSPDVPTVDRLVADYGFPCLPPLQAVYGIIGRSVLRSVSPRVHNAGYRALDIPALYVPFQVEDFASFWSDVAESGLAEIGFPLRAATVVSPHKEAALTTARTTSHTALRSGAANSLVRRGNAWCADTSNSPAISRALDGFDIPVSGRKAAVVGCGGAGRAAALALAACGADPVLVNRDPHRGRAVAEALGFDFTPLDVFRADRYSVLVHATPVTDDVPFRLELPDDAVVVDMVYTSEETAVVAAARDRGLAVVDGWDVLLADAGCQFHFMTGQHLPTEQTRALLRAARIARRDLPSPTPLAPRT
ncbi:3-dehydroquinate dehydratase/shikimate dehydrogenase [Prauserella sediminis]|uniref:3-dehydroquinate dehydratase/shikimate dehydrogenase n=1 Tax=Prauserella sediminis TaxID=577680 RepID=A0A839XGQ8_9PSEU|nr:bifunctional type I 3-dehydroquinate dehydratase/shikimate dehydrogenase [Prauserella sediminis]MBB3661657.1 3-dehydroquinate dehydratase/shikimate dehydrogenase [Prauserella sediminis]